jgi:hypothetical protein
MDSHDKRRACSPAVSLACVIGAGGGLRARSVSAGPGSCPIFGKFWDPSAAPLIAQAYLRNGDFWSKSRRVFTVDATALRPVELAVEWYHRVITEFPKSASAEIAFERKLFTLFGWREPGENGNAFSVEKDLGGYMPMLLPTF